MKWCSGVGKERMGEFSEYWHHRWEVGVGGGDGKPPCMAPTEFSCPLHPAPSPVTIMSCISTSGGYGVILTWSCPQGGYEAFEWQVGGQGDSQNRSSCGRSVSVSDLRPAQSYPATVTTIWDGMKAPSVSVTCHTDNAGEQSPMGQEPGMNS